MVTFLVLLLVLVSVGLIITVPVALATPGDWEASRPQFDRAFQVWVSLVLIIAAADGISSSV